MMSRFGLHVLYFAMVCNVFALHAESTKGGVIHLQSEAALDAIIKNNKFVVIDFSAPWCKPCQMIAPILEQYAQQFTHITFISAEISSFPSIANKYSIRSVPTFLFFKHGQQISHERFSNADGSTLRSKLMRIFPKD